MELIRTTLLGLTVILSTTSCGYQISKATTTTTTTTTYGRDCNSTAEQKMAVLMKAGILAQEKSTDADGVPTRTGYLSVVREFRKLRSYIRSLDIPTLSNEQTNLADAIEKYLNAYNDYWDSNNYSLAVNELIIPLADALDDFGSAWAATCS